MVICVLFLLKFYLHIYLMCLIILNVPSGIDASMLDLDQSFDFKWFLLSKTASLPSDIVEYVIFDKLNYKL